MNDPISRADCEALTERLAIATNTPLTFLRVNDLYRVESSGATVSFPMRGTKSEVYGQLRLALWAVEKASQLGYAQTNQKASQ